MYECDLTTGRCMWVSIGIGLTTVGGPSGVCNTDVVSLGGTGLLIDKVETVGLFTFGGIFGNLELVIVVAVVIMMVSC